MLDVRPDVDPRTVEMDTLVRDLRSHRPDFAVYVSGYAGQHIEFLDAIAARAAYVVGLVALATFVLLFLMTGSLLVPLKALVMNMLSLSATFGVLVWIFQDGHLAGLLGFKPPARIDPCSRS